ncbi:uncharacterized mitochondrial protein AtMg00860-like [Humulus lupulus]|uniref:uncharacterized mitochondrial protein AtMg00860-like n=1 Tax=Humulus lupulus TaxID=3486 RepID=UPI002B4031DF|nr:uncharacterized mitochondrial protein AtMg00860-like [Humulus lupulus]
MTFLRYIVIKDEVKVDPAKIEVVRDCPRPMSSSKITCFLGLARYYRHFIEGFSIIATPLKELTRKNLKFVWLEKCENNFHELKRRSITSPVLILPSDQENFVEYCDALRQGLGCILMLDGKVIAYPSQQLKEYEQ